MIVPRKLFDRNLIKEFIGKTVEGLGYHTIVTDGNKRYKNILYELRLNQQRCIFHSMQNLMSRENPVHSLLKRKIKSINKKIAEKEKKNLLLKIKNRGMISRSKKDDTKRKKDIEHKTKLQSELNQLKAEHSKHRNYIKNNNRYVKKISRILKAPNYEKGIERFEELWAIKDELSDEIRIQLENLKGYLHQAL